MFAFYLCSKLLKSYLTIRKGKLNIQFIKIVVKYFNSYYDGRNKIKRLY
jgi:hypothetical protein